MFLLQAGTSKVLAFRVSRYVCHCLILSELCLHLELNSCSILGSGALCWYIGLDKFAPNITELLGLEDSAGGGVDADKIQALERQIASFRKLAKDLLLAQEESLRWSAISRGVLHLGLFGTAVYCINQRKDDFKRLSRRYASAALHLQVTFRWRRSIGGCVVPSLSSD